MFRVAGFGQDPIGALSRFTFGVFELRSGIPDGVSPNTAGPDMIRAMSTDLFLDFVGIRMDGRRTTGMAFKINLITPDNGEQFVVELSNETLTNIKGHQADDADLTITIDREDLEFVMRGEKSLRAQIEDGTATAEGDVDILAKLAEAMVTFELGFEILPGTKGHADADELNPYEVGPLMHKPE